MASVTAAVTGIRFIKDALEVVREYKVDIRSQQRINDALKEAVAVYDTLFDLREELFRLQSVNKELNQQLKEQKELQNKKDQYKIEKTTGGAMVYVSISDPKHYACPVCFNKGDIQILQDRNSESWQGFFDCYNCGKSCEIEPLQRDQEYYGGGMSDRRGPHGWMS
jgi:transcription elongation factor Elf1